VKTFRRSQPHALKRGIDKAVERAVKNQTPQERCKRRHARAGWNSLANGDATIGNIIAQAMDKVGKMCYHR